MLSYLYSKQFYNFIKSGFLVDFYFKKTIYFIMIILFKHFNIFFSEKYIIENIFLKINFYINYYKYFLNSISNNFSYFIIGFIIL